MSEIDSNNIKPLVAGVKREIFLTLSQEDKKFLEIIDRLGYSLDDLHARATKGTP